MQRAGKTNQSELALEIGVKPQTIQYLASRGKSSIHTPDIAKALNCSYEWLAKGEGLIGDTATDDETDLHQEKMEYRVPVVGKAQLGPDGYWEETQHPVGHGDGGIAWRSCDSNAYALLCVGDSMSPRIRHGEYVIVEPNHQIIPGDEVLIKTVEGLVMIKLYLYERDSRIHLESINNSYGQIIVETKNVTKLHYVAGIAKKALHRM